MGWFSSIVNDISGGVSHLGGEIGKQASLAYHMPGKFVTQGAERAVGVGSEIFSPIVDLYQLKPVQNFLNSHVANEYSLGLSGNTANMYKTFGTLAHGQDPTQQELSNTAQYGVKAAAVIAAVYGGEAAYSAYGSGGTAAGGTAAAGGASASTIATTASAGATIGGIGYDIATGKYRQAATASGLPAIVTNQIPLPSPSGGVQGPTTPSSLYPNFSFGNGGGASGGLASAGSSMGSSAVTWGIVLAVVGLGFNVLRKK